MLSATLVILLINIIICSAFISSSKLGKRKLSSKPFELDLSQYITEDNIVAVEITKGIVQLGTIALFTTLIQKSGNKRIEDLQSSGDKRIAEIQSSGDKRIAEIQSSLKATIEASDKRTNDHISANDKRFSDMLASMKEVKVIEGDLRNEKMKFTNENIKKLTEDVEKIKEK